MNFIEYQTEASRTAIYPARNEIGGLLYCTLGLAGESGELANKVKKILRDDLDIRNSSSDDWQSLINELGDILWYVSQLCHELQVEMQYVAWANIQKLRERANKGTLHGKGDNR